MKLTKSLFGTLLGSIGILAGFGMLMTGCGDDDKSKDSKTEINQEQEQTQIDQCCQKADDYDACVKEYQKNGVCSNDDPDDISPDLYGPLPLPPVEYGPIDPEPTDEDIAQCCGDDDGSKAYTECVENYKGSSDSKVCIAHDIEQPDVYGPPPSDIDIDEPDDDKIKECCGDDDGSKAYKECVENYKGSSDSKVCIAHDIEQPDVYGPPPSDIDEPDDKIKECCGDDNGSEEYKECVADYQKSGTCPLDVELPEPMPEPTYGMPDVPDEQPDA